MLEEGDPSGTATPRLPSKIEHIHLYLKRYEDQPEGFLARGFGNLPTPQFRDPTGPDSEWGQDRPAGAFVLWNAERLGEFDPANARHAQLAFDAKVTLRAARSAARSGGRDVEKVSSEEVVDAPRLHWGSAGPAAGVVLMIALPLAFVSPPIGLATAVAAPVVATGVAARAVVEEARVQRLAGAGAATPGPLGGLAKNYNASADWLAKKRDAITTRSRDGSIKTVELARRSLQEMRRWTSFKKTPKPDGTDPAAELSAEPSALSADGPRAEDAVAPVQRVDASLDDAGVQVAAGGGELHSDEELPPWERPFEPPAERPHIVDEPVAEPPAQVVVDEDADKPAGPRPTETVANAAQRVKDLMAVQPKSAETDVKPDPATYAGPTQSAGVTAPNKSSEG